jgi:hypothetical protein
MSEYTDQLYEYSRMINSFEVDIFPPQLVAVLYIAPRMLFSHALWFFYFT